MLSIFTKTRTLLILAFFLFFQNASRAQNDGVAIGILPPHASSILDIQSDEKGLLIPRLTTTQKESINDPAAGLLVYDTDLKGFWFYNETMWSPVESQSVTSFYDNDQDTGIDVEGSGDEDKIFFDVLGNTEMILEKSRLRFPGSNGSIFIGDNAGINSTLGNNIGIGNSVLLSNNGINNIGIGGLALFNNIGTAASDNIAVGWESLQINSGKKNVAVGSKSLNFNSADYNVAIGDEALALNLGSEENIAIGYQAMATNFGSGKNIAIGSNALVTNSGEGNNIALGYKSLNFNGNGTRNTALGNNVLEKNTFGNDNVGAGYQALNNNQTGNNTVAIGVGAAELDTIASNSVYIGYEAGSGISTHDKSGNIHIGYQAGKSSMSSNTLIIDNNDDPTPLIWGDMESDSMVINGSLGVTGPLGVVGAFTFPESDGMAGRVMKTNGNGQILWAPDNVNDSDFNPGNELITQMALNQDTLKILEAGVVHAVDLNELKTSTIADSDSDTAITTEETVGDNKIKMKVENDEKLVVNNQSVNIKSTLQLQDILIIQPSSEPVVPVKGMIYFDDTTNKLRVYDGTVWQDCF